MLMNVTTTTMAAAHQTLTVSTSLDLLNVNVKEAMKRWMVNAQVGTDSLLVSSYCRLERIKF